MEFDIDHCWWKHDWRIISTATHFKTEYKDDRFDKHWLAVYYECKRCKKRKATSNYPSHVYIKQAKLFWEDRGLLPSKKIKNPMIVDLLTRALETDDEDLAIALFKKAVKLSKERT